MAQEESSRVQKHREAEEKVWKLMQQGFQIRGEWKVTLNHGSVTVFLSHDAGRNWEGFTLLSKEEVGALISMLEQVQERFDDRRIVERVEAEGVTRDLLALARALGNTHGE